MVESPDCAGTDLLIPELAIGVAAGDDRAWALGHLAQCTRCRSELESVTLAADALLLLAPEREPPPGFESRVLSGVRPQQQPPQPVRRPARFRRRLRRTLVQVAAAAVVAALAAGAAWWRTADDRRLATSYRHTLAVAHGKYLRAAPLLADGAIPIGHLFAYEGEPSWLLAVVRSGPGAGRYTVRMTTRDGEQIALGAMTVKQGEGTWHAPIYVPVNEILAVHLTDPRGRDLTARLG